jgi:hypothetical protein
MDTPAFRQRSNAPPEDAVRFNPTGNNNRYEYILRKNTIETRGGGGRKAIQRGMTSSQWLELRDVQAGVPVKLRLELGGGALGGG